MVRFSLQVLGFFVALQLPIFLPFTLGSTSQQDYLYCRDYRDETNKSFSHMFDLMQDDFPNWRDLPAFYCDSYSLALTGTIPSKLYEMTLLETLQISAENVTGTISPDIGKLEKLTSLYLWGNALNGSIPSEVGQLTNIRFIALSNNRLTGTLSSELGNLKEMIYLSLDNNGLTGSVPQSLVDNITSLERFYIYDNAFTGVMPQHESASLIPSGGEPFQVRVSCRSSRGRTFQEVFEYDQAQRNLVKYATRISCENGGLVGSIPPSLGESSSLESLSLAGNNLSGKIPAQLGDAQSLVDLNLANNGLSGTIPSRLGELENLVDLFLDGNGLTGKIPQDLEKLSALQYLDLKNNSLTGRVPDIFKNMKSLHELYLKDNEFSGIMPKHSATFSDTKSGEVLNPEIFYASIIGPVVGLCLLIGIYLNIRNKNTKNSSVMEAGSSEVEVQEALEASMTSVIGPNIPEAPVV